MAKYRTVNQKNYGLYGNWVHDVRDYASTLGKLKQVDEHIACYPTLTIWLYISGRTREQAYDELMM